LEPPPLLDHEWGVDRYAPIRTLGEGTFGVVYLAEDRQLDRKIALKLPKRPRPTSEQDATDFLFEARHLARLDHPGIVPVYDAGRAQDGRCYVVSKYIEGEDLGRRLKRRGRLKPREAAELVRQVALALYHAHAHGLVHRDIKPANILLGREDPGFDPKLDASRAGHAILAAAARSDEPGVRGLELEQAYIADFGLALKTEDVQLASQVAGTPAYMSPEQITGDVSQLDGRSDIFSLGVVFYELLVGERPFRGKSLAALLGEICSGTPLSPDRWDRGVPEMLSAICMKCLVKRPADRFQTGKQLADALHRWLTLGERAQDKLEAPVRPPPPKRKRFGVLSAIALGVVVGALAINWLWSTVESQVVSQSKIDGDQLALPRYRHFVVPKFPAPVKGQAAPIPLRSWPESSRVPRRH
jgi:serine/threonine protein kinase